jgi:hypothetical protein
MHLGTLIGSVRGVQAARDSYLGAEMVTRLQPSTTGEWLGNAVRPGRPLEVRTFTLSSFAVQRGQVVAVGTLSAMLMPAAGAGVDTSVVTTVALPVSIGRTSAETLDLDIGPATLDLLGLQLNLSKMTLNITAQAGPGHLLGAVAGVADDPPALAKLLNRILETL